MEKLFENETYFVLKHDNRELIICEPNNFDSVENVFEEDTDFNFGYNTDYIPGDIQLEFPNKEGGDYISNIYDTLGTDQEVIFEFGILNGQVREYLIRGSVNLNTFKRNKSSVFCNVENTSFSSLLRTRIDATVTINDDKTIDGKTTGQSLTAITTKKLRLHSKEIIKQTIAAYDASVSSVYAEINDGSQWTSSFIQPDTDNLETNELVEVFNLPLGMRTVSPETVSAFQYQAAEAGLLRAKYVFSGTARVENSPTITTVKYFLKIVRAAVLIKTLEFTAQFSSTIPIDPTTGASKPFWVSGQTYNAGDIVRYGIQHYRCKFNGFSSSTPPPSDTTNWEDTAYWSQFTIQNAINGTTGLPEEFKVFVEANDEVYIGIEIQHAQTNTTPFTLTPQVSLDGYQNTIDLLQSTLAPATRCNAYRLFDVITQVVEAITNKTSAVISPFYDTGGAAEKFALFNGYSIRQFDVANKPMQTSLSDLRKCIKMLHNVGFGYRTVNGEDRLYIGPMMDFNGTGVILEIKDHFDYEEEHVDDVVFNQAEIGYDKFAEDDKNTVDEFNTQHQNILPVKTYKNQYSQSSPYSASGFLMEKQRREQFADEPSTSLSDDDTIFITPYSENYDNFWNVDKVVYNLMGFEAIASGNVFKFDREIGAYIGDWFFITNSVSNNGVLFTITDIVGTATGIEYVVNNTPTNETGSCTVNVAYNAVGNGIIAERNEPFANVSEVLSPSSVYGLRISPKRCFFNHAPLINIGLWYQNSLDKIVNTFAKNNDKATSQFLSTEPNPLLTGTASIEEGADVTLSDYYSRQRAYLPKGISCKTTLSYENVILIKQALRGELGDTRDYGRFLITDDKGQRWYVKLKKMKYKPKTGVAEMDFVKIEKYT